MSKLKGIFWIVVLLAIVAIFVYRNRIPDYFSPQLQQVERLAINAAFNEIRKEISLPQDFVRRPAGTTATSPKTASPSPLAVAGTIKWTNVQRKNNGLPALTENGQLDTVASLRIDDMFAKQYFAHISPTGAGAESVAKDVGYDYLALGENLALGNFTDDHDLVLAWMGSPGHRANILNAKYQQIGVAVRKGTFEGRSTWLAVQIFGKPAAACPKVDETLKSQIDSSESQLASLEQTLVSLKAEIENMQPERGSEYNAKVDQYNSLIAQYNNLFTATKALINTYNGEVNAFNSCLAQ